MGHLAFSIESVGLSLRECFSIGNFYWHGIFESLYFLVPCVLNLNIAPSLCVDNIQCFIIYRLTDNGFFLLIRFVHTGTGWGLTTRVLRGKWTALSSILSKNTHNLKQCKFFRNALLIANSHFVVWKSRKFFSSRSLITKTIVILKTGFKMPCARSTHWAVSFNNLVNHQAKEKILSRDCLSFPTYIHHLYCVCANLAKIKVFVQKNSSFEKNSYCMETI